MRSRRLFLRAALAAMLLVPAAVLPACGGSGGSDDPGGLRVGIVHAVNPSYAQDVQDNLVGTGQFASVGVLYAGSPITLSDIESNFDVILVMKDGDFFDEATFGDILADAVDDGVGVVLSAFCYEAGVIQGRFASDDYFTMTSGTDSGGGPLGYTEDVPGHPLLTDVTLFGGGDSSYRTTGTPYPSSTKVASWLVAGSPPLLVERTLPNGALRVDVGFYPPTASATTGRTDFVAAADSVTMLANALLRVGGQL